MGDWKQFFGNKKVTLMGLGVLGRGVGDAEFLAPLVSGLIVTDKKSEADLASSIERLQKFPNVTYRLGGHDKKDFQNVDMIIKAAGVPLDSPYIAEAKAANVPVYMSTALFAKFAIDISAKVVGVTGTRGKSTVVHMIHHALVQAKKRTHLGGNIRGKSTLAMLPEITSGDICVLELDSWQLQGFGELKLSPQISVFTNFMSDHLNYYGGDMDAYFADKANVFKFQKPDDVLITGASVVERVRSSNSPLDPIIPDPIPREWKLSILGEHNRENAALAGAALSALGISEEEVREGLESFEGVEGRLQFVREVKGVKIYNDNNATTPEATIAALRAVGDRSKRNVVLILGGDDKGLNMSELIKEIPLWCSKTVLFKEQGTDRVRDEIFALEPKVNVYEVEGLKDTIEKAFLIAEPGEAILYSPAFSSFGKYFKNEFDRNDQFMKIVSEL